MDAQTCQCADQEVEEQRVRTPMKKYKNIWFLSNTGPHPLKITKQPGQNSMLGHHHLNGVSLTDDDSPLAWYLDLPSPHQLTNVVKVGPLLTNCQHFLDPRMLSQP